MSTMTLEKLFEVKEMLHKDFRHLIHFIRITRTVKIKVTDTALLYRITSTGYFIMKIQKNYFRLEIKPKFIRKDANHFNKLSVGVDHPTF